jgi:hypothetical protein
VPGGATSAPPAHPLFTFTLTFNAMNEPIGTLLEQSLMEIWNERDASRREAAINRLYAPDMRFYEHHAIIEGRAAIHAHIGAAQAQWPAEFVFHFDQGARVNHELVQLSWTLGPAGQPVVYGMDVAVVEQGYLKSLHVFLDPPANGKAAD